MRVPLAPLDEIPEGGTRKADFFGREVLLTRVNGRPRAIMNVCMHLGGPLEQNGDQLVCGWHGAEWCLRDGTKLNGPGRTDARLLMLPIKVLGGVVTYVYGED